MNPEAKCLWNYAVILCVLFMYNARRKAGKNMKRGCHPGSCSGKRCTLIEFFKKYVNYTVWLITFVITLLVLIQA